MLPFNTKQLGKLSDLFMDIARGLFIAAIAAPVVTKTDFIILLKLFLSAIVCVYFSLKLIDSERG